MRRGRAIDAQRSKTSNEPDKAGAQRRAARLRFIRDTHRLIGLFIAPSVMFFALTGLVQLVGLHEARGDYKPPALIEKLSQVHTHQAFAAKAERPRPPGAATDATDAPREEPPTPIGVTLLKVLFLVVATGLFLSTALGVWIALTRPQRNVATAVLGAGVLLPVVFMLLSSG